MPVISLQWLLKRLSKPKMQAAMPGYGVMMLLLFLMSTVLIGTSLQMMLGPGAASYLGAYSLDTTASKELAISGMETVLADIQSKLNGGTSVTSSYTYNSTSITMPTDPANLGGGITTIGSYSATMTAARGNTYLVQVTATVNNSTATYSKLVSCDRYSKLLDSMTGANAAYSLRLLRFGYSGSAIRVRRSSDNTEQDIGFDGNGNLDVAGLKTFLSASTKPVDAVSGATVAFSIRRLRNGYAGYAMNVRRSSDSATQDIGFTSTGDLDTASLLSFVGTGTGYVTTWYDQSGNGTNATQATTTYQPTIVVNGVLNMVNNRPAILYDGNDDRLTFTRTISDDFTMMACYSVLAGYNVASGYPNWYDHAGILDADVGGVADDFGISVDTAGSLYVGVGNPDTTILSPASGTTGYTGNGGYNDNRMHWLGMSRVKSTGYFALYQDAYSYAGPDANATNTNSLTSPTSISIGRITTSTAPAKALNGYINEVLAYGSNLSTSNRLTLQRNESWYFNMYPIWGGWTYPLNAISTIPANTVAYGLRRLYTGFNYAAIQVRRSSDNTTQNIGWDAASNLDVASLMSFCGSSSCYVTTWYDQSGNGMNLFQSTNANQPRIVNSGVLDTQNGKPAVYFNGSSSAYMYNTGLTANTSNTVSALAYASYPSNQGNYARIVSVFQNGQYDYSNTPSGSLIQINNDGSKTIQTERNSGSTGRLTTTPTFEYGVPFLATSIFDGANGYLYLNGNKGASYAFNSTFNYTNLYVANSPTSDYFTGYVQEIYLMPVALSSSDRTILQQNILAYYSPPLVAGYVSKWYDQSGNSHDMVQTDSTMQPEITMPPYGNNTTYPVVLFNGAQSLSTTGGMPTNADYSKTAVFSYFTYNGSGSLGANNLISGTASNSHAFYTNGTNYICLFQYNGCYATSTLPMTTNTTYAISGTYTNSSPTRTGVVYRTNTQGGTGSTGHANGSDTSIALGTYVNSNYFYGTMSEAMIFARSLSIGDRTTIYNDERAYFGAQ